jgi:hypothetical protein
MAHISIRDLQKISGEAISNLPGATAVKSGGRTVALLIPLKRPDPERLRAWAEKVEAMARERDPAEDERFLRELGADPTVWSADAIRELLNEGKPRK